ncbi:MAG: nickel pincer cofactor biosynthesis protein LarC [Muribaculaceae bacterium]|nr:nickel pincer cofactor biosynthesis protein LarC [Roseburia sp.]MCM1430345.1 nickel pincer cofactor biosynthesis protein LarC [Muribaculaceae bacterium]MCM1492459.1 nickel pincer cofactor biosynthesis protein LarC [Muribaculaceae bacterium]
MKTLYIECKMGAAGDMLMAALYELLDSSRQTEFIEKMNEMFAPEIHIHASTKQAAGITGTHMHVHIHGQEEHVHGHGQHEHEHVHAHGQHEHEHVHGQHEHGHVHAHGQHEHTHAHHSYSSILEQIDRLPLPPKVRADAAAVYRLIGNAEAKVHDSVLEQIHFHEVGSLDALADVVGTCLLFSLLDAKQIIVSPIHVGSGMVECAHGILPVPAPATAEILKGIPFYTGNIETELCTPTGAAILRYFATGFGAMPAMQLTGIGVGHGTKELPMLNALRCFLGDTEEDLPDDADTHDRILDISCNLDDMTGEALGYAMHLLLKAGALDVFYIPIQMKKNRPGILLHCLCSLSERDKFIQLMFRHTTTRGVRYQIFDREKMVSHTRTKESAYGPIAKKISERDSITKVKYEFDNLKEIAEREGLSLWELCAELEKD